MRNCVNHPDRPHVAKGLCSPCYNKKYRDGRKNDPLFKHKEKERDRVRWASKTAEEKLDKTYKNNYGVSYEFVLSMWKEQNGKCDSCGDPVELGFNNGVLDHCHTTSKIRGVLCHPCNVSLGFLRDDENRILNLLEYLRKHNGRT